MRVIEKELAISVFNYYKLNPADQKSFKDVNYRNIKKVKTTKPKKENENTKGEIFMQSSTLLTKNNQAVVVNPIKRIENKLKEELEKVKATQEGINIISEETYSKTIKDVSERDGKPTKTQQNIIDSYIEQQNTQDKIKDLMLKIENLKPFQVSIDAGKYNTKYTYVLDGQDIFKNDIFESRTQRASDCRHDGGKKFFVGPEVYSTSGSAKRVSDRDVIKNDNVEPMPNTKAHEYHRILMLKALYNIYQATGRTVFNVVVGTSIDSYLEDEGSQVYLTMLGEELPEQEQTRLKNAETLEEEYSIYKEYAQKLKDSFIVKEFIVRESGGEPVTLIVNDLYVAPETVTGATMIEADDLTHAFVMDFGGLNDTYLPIVNGSPLFEDIISNKNGMTKKYERIAAWLVSKSSETTAIDKNGVEVMLNNRETMLDRKTDELITNCIYSMLDDITHQLKTHTVALKEGISTLICIGGGTQVLAPYIEGYYSTRCDMKGKLHIASADGIYSNVTGMYEAGVNYFDERDYIRSQMQGHTC